MTLLFPVIARADDGPPAPSPPPPAYDAARTPAPREAPPAYTYEPAPIPPALGHGGFQLALRPGVSIPFGSVKEDDPDDAAIAGGRSSMSDVAGWQIPLTLDIGGKPNKHLFIGGYFTFARGLAAGALADSCDALRLDCNATTVRFGAQVHYAIAPDEWINPWLGYGLGFAWLSVGDDNQSTRLRGFDFGHFMGGFDVRLSRTIGLGPFADFTVGKYSNRSVETQGQTFEGAIEGRAFHYWLTVGPRLVFMP